MTLISQDFSNNQNIPAKFTCDGEDVSPCLTWSDFPAKSKSFALSCFDPDAPGAGFIHWLAVNLPIGKTTIAKGENLSQIANEIINDFGQKNYGGPCPPVGRHRYDFTVYALAVDSLANITKENFFEEVEKHTLAKASLIGLYKRV